MQILQQHVFYPRRFSLTLENPQQEPPLHVPPLRVPSQFKIPHRKTHAWPQRLQMRNMRQGVQEGHQRSKTLLYPQRREAIPVRDMRQAFVQFQKPRHAPQHHTPRDPHGATLGEVRLRGVQEALRVGDGSEEALLQYA